MAYSTRASKRGLSGGKVLEAGPRAEVTTGKFICEGAEVTHFVTGRTPLSQFHPQTKISWVEQCSALVCGQRSITMGRGVDELDMQMSISDLVELGALRRVSGKSLDVPAQLAPLNSISSTWSNRKMILVNTVHVSFASRPWYRPQNIHDVDSEQMKQQIGHEHLLPPFLRKVSEVEGLLASPSARYIEAVFFAINDWRRATTTFDKVLCWSRFIAHVRGTTVLSVYGGLVASFVAGGYMAINPEEIQAFQNRVATFEAQRMQNIVDILAPHVHDPPVLNPEDEVPMTQQSTLDTLDGCIDKAEHLYDNIGKFWKTPVAQTLKSLWLVIVATMVSQEEGVKVTKEQVDRLRRVCQSQEWYFSEENPVEFVIRSTIMVTRLVISCLRAGNVYPIYGDEAGAIKWLLDAQAIIALGNNLSILECYGTDVHKLTRDIDSSIADGNILARTTSGFQQKEVISMLGRVQIVKNNMLSKTLASATREPPFAVAFHGGTSVGKTSLVDMFHVYFAKLTGLDPSLKFRYSRNSSEDHWNNFTSKHWSILFDEIAPYNATTVKEPDVMTREILGVCNSAPYTPTQAALEDKGKTPCLAKLVVGTTNVLDLNTPTFFENPTAIMRRFHMIVDVKVKDQYKMDTSSMLDYSKTQSDAFPDFWTFRILRAVPVEVAGLQGPRTKQSLSWQLIAEFDNVASFLRYSADRIIAHRRECMILKSSRELTYNMELCETCSLPSQLCGCAAFEDAVIVEAHMEQQNGADLNRLAELEGIRFRPPPQTPRDRYFEEWMESTTMSLAQRLRHFGVRKTMQFSYESLDVARREYFYKRHVWENGMPLPNEAESVDFWNAYSKFVQEGTWSSITNVGLFKTMSFWKMRAHRNLAVGKRILTYLGVVGTTVECGAYIYEHLVTRPGEFLSSPKMKMLYKGLMVAGPLLILAYKASEHYSRESMKPQLEHAIKESPVNQKVVWYKSDYRTTGFDVGRVTPSWVGKSQEWLIDRLARNVSKISTPDAGKMAHSNMINLGGNLWVTTAHFFNNLENWEERDEVVVNVEFGGGPGVSQDILGLTIRRDNLWFKKESDLCYIYLPTVTPRKKIVGILPNRSLRGSHTGFCYRIKKENGNFVGNVSNFTDVRWDKVLVDKTRTHLSGWAGTTTTPTAYGDCGGLAISMSTIGPIALGIHSMGAGNRVFYAPLCAEEVTEALTHFQGHLLGSSSIMLPPESPTLVNTIHEKSPLRFIEQGSAEPIGTFLGERAEPKSKLVDSPLRKPLEALGWDCPYGPPMMKGWLPKHNALKDILSPHTGFKWSKLMKTADEVSANIISKLHAGWQSELGVVSLDVAINGIHGVAHMDRLNISTSCGFPYKGPKKAFLDCDEPDFNGRLTLNPIISSQVDTLLATWAESELAGIVITAALKDEPRKLDKIASGSTRMFQVAPMAATVAMRKLLLSFLRLFYNNHEAFMSAPGMDATSGEWNQMANWLSEMPNFIDGDYAKFDTILKGDLMQAVLRVIVNIAEASGKYTETELTQIRACVFDNTYCFINFFGDFLRVHGINSSGNAATVLFNCLANYIIMVYAFNDLKTGDETFIEHVRAMFYGDDNLMGVSEQAMFFNFASIQSALRDMGITYTPADKTATAYSFKCLDKCEFLQRTFRYDERLEHTLAPLKLRSFSKMVMVAIPSTSVPYHEQIMDSVASCVRESFLHGEEVFLQIRNDLQQAVISAGYLPYAKEGTFPSYETLLKAYVEKSKDRDFFRASLEPGRYKTNVCVLDNVEQPNTLANQNVQTQDSYCPPLEQQGGRMDLVSSELERPSDVFFSTEFSSDSIRSQPCVVVGPHYTRLNNRSNKSFQFQSGSEPVEREIAETTQFQSEAADNYDGFSANPSVSSAMDRVALGNFLTRPVQISYTLWTPANNVGNLIDIRPWNLFLNNAYMAKKLANYSYIRGNLKVKILVNATPFVYGSALVSYWPLCGLNRDRTTPSTNAHSAVTRSQRPSIWIDPSSSKGGVLTLPFFYPRDWLELNESAATKAMGALSIDVVNALQSATTSANIDCSIQVYAWMEDVELTGPTVGLFQQSGHDEFKGPISAPASAVAAASRELKTMPVIGKLATAAEIGATAVAKVSSLFGFSNKVDLEGATKVQPNPFPDLATVGTSYPTARLVLDPKNSLGADGSSLGLPREDHMNISHIVTRESYATQFSWNPSQVTDTLLFCGRVTPKIYALENIGTNPTSNLPWNKIHMVPMCMVSKLFRYWRGSIIVKFRFVATPYHKGRLIISYDPTGTATSNLANTADTTAVVQTYIVDMSTLGDDREFEICIPYSQSAPWSMVYPEHDSEWTNIVTPAYERYVEEDNGVISVRVQTELSSPSGSGTVPIQVFVRGGPDLEFGSPGIDNSEAITAMEPQSGHEDITTVRAPDDAYLLNMGEKVSDLRSVIQRRSRLMNMKVSMTNTTYYEVTNMSLARTPLTPGWVSNGLHVIQKVGGVGNAAGNCVEWTALSWLWPHFVGHRGSIDYVMNGDFSSPCGHFSASRTTQDTNLGKTTGALIGTATDATLNYWMILNTPSSTGGVSLTSTSVLPSLSVSFPMYHFNKFFPNEISLANNPSITNADWPIDPVGDNFTQVHLQKNNDVLTNTIVSNVSDVTTGRVEYYLSAGLDFQFLWFIGCQPVWNHGFFTTI